MKYLLPLLLVVALGCGKDSSSGTVTSAGKSVIGNQVSLAEMSLTLPEGWKVFDLTKADFSKALDDWAASSPEVKATADGVKAMASNKMIRLFAFDVANSKTGFTDNLNVIVLDQGVPKDLNDMIAQSSSQISMVPGGKILTPFKKKNLGSAEYASGVFQMTGPGGAELAAYAYSALKNGKAITITFTCVKTNMDRFSGDVKKVMGSVELK